MLSFWIIYPHGNYFKKEKKCCFKKKFLKWNYSDDFIADFDTDGDITLLKCKLCRKYTAQISSETQSHVLHGQILDTFCCMLTV